MQKKHLFLSTLLLLFILAGAYAAVPRLLTVQGRLKEAGSSVSGNYDMVFYIYNVESGGTALYTESHTGANTVPVNAGFFSTILGDITSLDLAFKEQYWLGIKVGSDSEMTPRIKLTNSSYAFVARDLNVGDNLNIDSGTLYVDISGDLVGIGTTSPGQKLTVSGNGIRITGVDTPMLEFYPSTGDQWRVQSQNDSTFSVFNVTDGRTYLLIDGSGNVGLNKTPSYRLDVNGTVNATSFYQNGSPLVGSYWTKTGNNIYYNDGNVGIGTASPGAKLDVNGVLNIQNQPIISGQMGTAMTNPAAVQKLAFNEFWVSRGITYDSDTRRFTVPVAGVYRITLNPFFATGAGAARVLVGINTDAPTATNARGHAYRESATYDTGSIDSVVSLNANDYIVFYLLSGTLYNQAGDYFNQFSIVKIA
ncbi:MAG: hypothetical protein V1493_05475 [Candidatus Diapherotrites archaeon]